MRHRPTLLFLTVLVIATSGLVYELLAGTLASYVLGDSVTQFSLTIGTYLFAMGVGAYLSKFILDRISERFVAVELAAAVVGGLSAPFLFLCFAHAESFGPFLYGTVFVIGTLVGLEIPLLMRILKEELAFHELVAKVLTFDYLGALIGSILFALVLVPDLGLTRTSLAFGILNGAVALASTFILADLIEPRARMWLRAQSVLVMLGLAGVLSQEGRLTDYVEHAIYADPVVYSKQTAHQRLVVTRRRDSYQLFLNGNLQFSSSDEHRYHEALVHPALALVETPSRVLILGGGDGLALREVFRYPGVEHVTLVDLDPGVTEMARDFPPIRALNRAALHDPRVELVHQDAMVWLADPQVSPFDAVVIDFPDPNNFALGKLYTRRFYHLVRRVMHDASVLVVQATSPLYARKSYWCIVRTLEGAGLHVQPYHATVPSFGIWGFALARPGTFDPPAALRVPGLRFLTDPVLVSLFHFSADMARVDVDENTLNDQRLVRYYESEWSAYH